jgi:hypothetical protein
MVPMRPAEPIGQLQEQPRKSGLDAAASEFRQPGRQLD